MEVGEGLGASLVVFDEPAEAGRPCEGSLDNPSSGQEHEAALGFRQRDDLERDALFSGRCGGLFSGIALVDESDLDVLAGFRLNGLGDGADLGAIVSVCGRDMEGQKMAKGFRRRDAVSIPSCVWRRHKPRERRFPASSARSGCR